MFFLPLLFTGLSLAAPQSGSVRVPTANVRNGTYSGVYNAQSGPLPWHALCTATFGRSPMAESSLIEHFMAGDSKRDRVLAGVHWLW